MKYAPRNEEIRRKIREAVVDTVVLLMEPQVVEEMQQSSDDEGDVPDAVVRQAPAAENAPRPRPSLSSSIRDAMVSGSSSTGSEGDDMIARRRIPAVRHQGPQSVKTELDTYLQQPIMKSNTDPLKYWSERANTFRLLTPAAIACLACPPSSVTSERMFSVAGDIVTKKRCSLKPDNLERLAIIKVNRRLLKK